MSLTDRQRFYFDTFNPVTLGNGTWYGSCSEADIAAYTNPVPTPLSPPFNSKAEGTRELTNFLTNQWPDYTVTDALNRMREVIRTPTPDWGPDVLVKIFRDIDVAFFNCALRFRVLVSWEDTVSMQFARFPDQRILPIKTPTVQTVPRSPPPAPSAARCRLQTHALLCVRCRGRPLPRPCYSSLDCQSASSAAELPARDTQPISGHGSHYGCQRGGVLPLVFAVLSCA